MTGIVQRLGLLLAFCSSLSLSAGAEEPSEVDEPDAEQAPAEERELGEGTAPEAPPSMDVASPSNEGEASPAEPDPFPSSLEEQEALEPELAAPTREVATPFDQHRVRLGLGVGWAAGESTDWLMLGAGVGYFVLRGLELHVDGSAWVLGSPFIATITPGVRYVFHMVPDIKPYLGTFYRHYFVDRAGYDTDSLGARAGLYFLLSPTSYLGGGLIYEHFLDDNLFGANQVYPEIAFAFAF